MADDKKFGNNDFEDIYSSSEKDGYEDIYLSLIQISEPTRPY